MARRTPDDRLEKLIEVAAGVFVESGFRRAQMDDVAERLGVSKGTVYRSVDSKESLLAAVLTYGDNPSSLPSTGPIEPIDLGELSTTIRSQLATAVASLELAHAAGAPAPAGRSPGDVADEVERLASELFALMSAHRVRTMVIDRCAPDVTELGSWFESGRYAIVDLWEAYLDRVQEQIEPDADRPLLARTIVELIALWAVKMPWDPAPRPYPADPNAACAAMVANLVTGGHS